MAIPTKQEIDAAIAQLENEGLNFGSLKPIAALLALLASSTPQPVAGGGSYTSATILSLQTDSTGTEYEPFGNQACTALDLINLTGTAIEYRRGGAGAAFPIPSNSSRLIQGITNANQISIRRVDTSNTRVTVTAEALS